jgi:hypothetical protein
LLYIDDIVLTASSTSLL